MTSAVKFLLVLLALAFGVIGYQSWRNGVLVARNYETSLRRDSIEAARDSTRTLKIDLLGDSLQAFQRRIVQAPQVADAVDRALAKQGVEQRKALALIAIALDSLALRTTSSDPTTEDSAGTRRASFRIDSTPFRGRVEVELPEPPAVGSIDLRLAVDSLTLDVRIGCGAPRDGIRPATINAVAPYWARVTFPTVTADDGVCQAPARGRWTDGFFAGPGFGIVIKPNGDAHGGGSFAVGYDFLRLLRERRR